MVIQTAIFFCSVIYIQIVRKKLTKIMLFFDKHWWLELSWWSSTFCKFWFMRNFRISKTRYVPSLFWTLFAIFDLVIEDTADDSNSLINVVQSPINDGYPRFINVTFKNFIAKNNHFSTILFFDKSVENSFVEIEKSRFYGNQANKNLKGCLDATCPAAFVFQSTHQNLIEMGVKSQ